MRTTLLVLFLFSSLCCSAQEEIFLENPSFKDFPRLSHTPSHWYDCGFPGESQVNIHPVSESKFSVNSPASHGVSYLGMVTRENETWESIGQRLSQPLIGGKTYSFSIHLAKSATYLSSISSGVTYPIERKKINFATPIILRIWGGRGYCNKEELLAESSLISNTDWQDFFFTLHPKTDFPYITFKAFYELPSSFPYNGNILLDNASSILEIKNEDYSSIDSIKIVRLASLEKLSKNKQSIIEKRIDEKFAPHSSKGINRYTESALNDEDRAFLKEQLNLVNFEPMSPYLKDKSIDAIIETVKKLNAIDDELKISLYINALERNWDKKRGKEALSLFVEAGIARYNIKIVKSIPVSKNGYFKGGYGDVYMCVY
ncbi:MAG: hypothetical protein ACI85O_002880 [Saprospiraceae bacterium]|jgi:hypothetical protein